AWVIPA
nr:Chain B, ALA-TRP-VAL-ILE-PRO-ALA [synthetic construct]6TOG_B Chain B, ALA-TRP-VAL-ILE-PRO-ALA [synthetic construct]6TOH_B Chain B, ALA-TRP-VAL-ILE-PRO-ALA [synthetic construct]6TOI_B Chain B, ALA-TRP-VAL-ILE-PRO-ALA [synthetic construct]6TOK_B Chain B, ALA-TRP-VAL-ILE-PRO-ALA [synthetic construct]6TON_B Chain B, ALA-TRP-VAL-ILE-PRO-ALA [synthetic construct]6TOO_B Chain B, ALA-TRP-VAL-ILE-PRO-ALA [synthetic construct]7OKE_B Chain B, ALA-TRP-VAL-ILE-PRO-ALA [synthetic construct]7OKF_B Chai